MPDKTDERETVNEFIKDFSGETITIDEENTFTVFICSDLKPIKLERAKGRKRIFWVFSKEEANKVLSTFLAGDPISVELKKVFYAKTLWISGLSVASSF